MHPDLKGRVSNVSALLPGMLENGLPPRRIVLEAYPSDRLTELRDRPLNELFQLCTGSDSQRPDSRVVLRFDGMPTAKNSDSPFPSLRAGGERLLDGAVESSKCTCLSAP